MRKLTVAILVLALLIGTVGLTALGAQNPASPGKETKVILDGTGISDGALVDGTSVYLPFRAVCEALGFTVSWSQSNRGITVFASKDGDSISIDVNAMKIIDNGHILSAAVFSGKGVLLIAGRTYVDSGLFSTIFPVSASYDSAGARIVLLRRNENTIIILNNIVLSQQDYLKTTIQYPQIKGLADASVENAINELLKTTAQKAQSEGEANAADMAQAVKDGFTGAVGLCETYFDYIIEYNQNSLLSIVLQDYQYAGGAHGSTIQKAFTFDLTNGKNLKLVDLLDDTTGYPAFINAAIRTEIDRRVASGNLSEFDYSPFEDIGPDPGFYLSGSGVVFFFQQYEYFPYAAGIQEFIVKFSDLRPMMKTAYRFLSAAPVTLSRSDENKLSAGDIGRVILSGNPTTGYTWHYTITDSSVLGLQSESFAPSGTPGLAGAGGTYTWDFKALTPGQAAVTFKYYRNWEGESSATAANTVVYNIIVS